MAEGLSEARDRWLWNHTSEVLAMLLNANPWRRGGPVRAASLNPYRTGAGGGGAAREGVPLMADNLDLLKRVFIDPSAGRGVAGGKGAKP